MIRSATAVSILVFLTPALTHAQQAANLHEGHSMERMATESDPSTGILLGLASGTSLNPSSAPAHMDHRMIGNWTLMMHGLAFVTGIVQTGPRGDDEIASMNWLMIAGARRAGRGAYMLRSMLSLDAATIGGGSYPELFQIGEQHDGVAIVDGQHPHDLFMELSASYTLPLGERASALFYGALMGDPALGPVAFPHRVSAAEIPAAVLGHHLQDSTHITADVLTGALDAGPIRIEASGFHGREPDDERWNIEHGKIDSFAARLTFRPSERWAAQISRGHIVHPEELHPGDVTRTTSSVLYSRRFDGGDVSAGAVWGRNDLDDGLRLNSYLAEASWRFLGKNFVFGRFERLDRNELFADDAAQEQIFEARGIRSFAVDALTVGYTRDIDLLSKIETGFGGDAVLYHYPSSLDPFYGSRAKAFHLFVRIRPHGGAGHQETPMAPAEHGGHHH